MQRAFTDAQLSYVRSLARQYVMAGGSLWGGPNATEPAFASDAIDLTRTGLLTDKRPDSTEEFYRALEHVADRTTSSSLDSAATRLQSESQTAGYLFGVMVGLEFANLVAGRSSEAV